MTPEVRNQHLFSDEFLFNFSFTKIKLICSAVAPITLPIFAGSAFRGIFGHSLRKLSCVARNTPCPECPLVKRCAYPGVFEVQPDRQVSMYSSVKDPPRPFVLEPPGMDGVAAGDTFELGLTLFGAAVEHYPWVIRAFDLAGARGVGRGRGTFELKQALSCPSMQILVEGDRIKGKPEILNAAALPLPSLNSHVDVEFDTPVRIKRDSRLTSDIDFPTLVRNLMRRIAYLGAFHCGTCLDADFQYWIDRAKSVECSESNLEWFDWTRHSERQNTVMQLGGVKGRVRYKGDLGPFIPLLTLGVITRVGKGTTFGLGKYRIL